QAASDEMSVERRRLFPEEDRRRRARARRFRGRVMHESELHGQAYDSNRARSAGSAGDAGSGVGPDRGGSAGAPSAAGGAHVVGRRGSGGGGGAAARGRSANGGGKRGGGGRKAGRKAGARGADAGAGRRGASAGADRPAGAADAGTAEPRTPSVLAPEEVALTRLDRSDLLNLVKGGAKLIALVLRDARWKMHDDEAEAIVDPAARMLHGRKKLQAAIQRATDPGLLAGARGAYVEARVLSRAPRTAPASAPRPAPAPPQANAGAPSVAPASGPVAAAAERPAAAPAINPQDVDLSNIVVSPQAAADVLLDMQASVMALG